MVTVEGLRTDPLLGRVLDGRYTVTAYVARGGMATVYEAIDARLDRVVAVKVMHPILASDADFVARFTREARAAARVNHPHVVAVHDQGIDATTGAVFLVMDLVRGRTVRELLHARGRLTALEALEILEPVAAALAAAHAVGLVHRDVKPENVLLGDDGRVLVADFGLARAVEASHLTAAAGLLIGTVAYLSPEQVQTGAADPRSDVYSAGVLLSELVTGAPPYTGESPLAVAYRHLHEDVPSPGVHPVLDALVLACTARDPRSRPADGASLLRAVRSARASLAAPRRHVTLPVPVPARHTERIPQPTPAPAQPALVPPAPLAPAYGDGAARRVDPPRRLQRQRQRRTGVVVLVVLALLTALAGAGGWWLGYGRWTNAPSLVSLAPTAARNAATAGHLTLSESAPVPSDSVALGQVAAQEPPAGTRLQRGDVVRVHYSSGPLRHTVPSLPLGAPSSVVGTALHKAGLSIGNTTMEYDDKVPAGGLLRLDPPAGSQQPTGKPVALVVSLGPRPVPVPDLRGQTRAAALATLTGARLTATVVAVFDDTVAAGGVVDQATAPGTPVLPGSAVVLRVSKGPEFVQLPRLIYQRLDQVLPALRDLGLHVVVSRLPTGPGEFVVESDPTGGSRVRAGSTVRLSVL